MLSDKLSELVGEAGLSSFIDFYYLLRYDEDADKHWARVMDRLSVPETFFWRQPDQFETLAQVIAPQYFAANPKRTLRIWSAACCTGEEPISIAMALAEAGLLHTHPIEIVGTDGSSAMVERARAASYGQRSFRQAPPVLKDKYFVQADDGCLRPDKRLMRNITYAVANLADRDQVANHAAANVVFCRNVFIYFSDEAIRNTVRGFGEKMPEDGFLFLGASESLTRLAVDFELAEVGKSFVYVKRGRRPLVELPHKPFAERIDSTMARGSE